MAYNKYKKVRNSQGVINLDTYVSDKEKTTFSLENENNFSGSASLRAISDYVEDDMKVINPKNMQHLVSVINCQRPDTFVDECEELEKLYHAHKSERLNKGTSAIHAYHIINSFKGTNVEPEIIHQAGIDLARALCGDEFAVKICTHLNTDNYHNHLVINAYSNDASKKFKDEFHLYRKIRELSDEIANQYGLEIMENTSGERKSVSELLEKWKPQENVKSVYREIKNDIKQCQKMSISIEDFKSKMRMAGYDIREEKDNLIFSKDGYQASSRSLGTRYYKESIAAQINSSIDKQERKTFQQFLTYEAKKQSINTLDMRPIKISKFDDNGNRISWLMRFLKLALKILERFGNTYLDASAPSKYPNNPSLAYVNDKIRLIQQAIEILEKYHINSQNGLKHFTEQIGYQLRTSQNNIAQLSETLEKMNSVLTEIEKESFFEKMLKDEHIDPENFEQPKVTPDDTKRCLAALDPILPKQRKQLWNAIHNSEFSLKNGMDTISRMDAERIIAFLNKPNMQMPETLISKNEYLQNKAIDILRLRAIDYVKQIEDSYNTETATDAQKRMLKRQLSPEQYEIISRKKITKALAIRALSHTGKKPEIKESDKINFAPPSKWMLRTLQDIKIAFPDDFSNIPNVDFAKMDKRDANKLISHYMAKFDDPFKVTHKEKKSKESKTKLNELPEEMKSIGNAYLEIQKMKKSFGIKNEEDLLEFKLLITTLSEKLKQLEGNAKEMSSLYGMLKKTQATINRCDSKMFLCGPLFGGEDKFIKESIESLETDAIDVITDLMNELPSILRKSKVEDIEKSSLSSGLFIPPDPEVILYLTKLNAAVPEAFINNEGNTISVQLLSSFEAAHFLKDLDDSDYLAEKYKKLMEDEIKSENIKKLQNNQEEFQKEQLRNRKNLI